MRHIAKPPTVGTNWVFMKPIKIIGQIFSDQTRCLPITSSRSNNKYIMVVYNDNSNAILTEPLKSQTKMELLHAYIKIHTFLTKRGLKAILQKLDNNAPGKLQIFMSQNDVSFQLVPPRQHQRNTSLPLERITLCLHLLPPIHSSRSIYGAASSTKHLPHSISCTNHR
jgi:hypothetical protein